ncbi:pentapeptide repeat-containing protein [Nocardia gipuzkoensis]
MDKSIRGVNFPADDLSTQSGDGLEIRGCHFQGVRLPSAITRTTIEGSHLVSCDLANAQVDESSLLDSAITSSRLTGMSWSHGVVRGSVIEARADLSSFRHTKFRNVIFRECDLRQSDFQRAEFRNVRFEGCNLTAAQFANAEMQHNVQFVDCALIDVGGVRGLAGSTVNGGDLLGLAASLAREVGIGVEW